MAIPDRALTFLSYYFGRALASPRLRGKLVATPAKASARGQARVLMGHREGLRRDRLRARVPLA